MNTKQDFLKALKENEDDTTTRLVYADWLDERGQHEEADRQRKWPAAKAWLVKLSEEHMSPPDFDDSYSISITYKGLIERGWWAMEQYFEDEIHDEYFEDKVVVSCANNFQLCDDLRVHRREFWQNWSIVTGMPLLENMEDKSSFSCAC